MGFVKAMGEIDEFGGGGSLVPGSDYPVVLTIGDPGVSKNGAPFIALTGSIYEGPCQATDVTRNLYLSPGKSSNEKNPGGAVGFLTHACRIITGKEADEGVPAEYGFECDQETGETDEAYGARAKKEFAIFYEGLSNEDRLAMMSGFLRIPLWDGKKVISAISVEESYKDAEGNNVNTAVEGGKTFFNNRFAGFYALNDTKRGLEHFRKVCMKQQEKDLAESK